ncbi:MAG TPA: amidase [Chthoniobacterales bacterium]
MEIEFQGLTAAELGCAFFEGRTDPVVALDFYLEQAKASGSVFISLCEGRARVEAEASRARWREGLPLSALDGVPIAWKDLFDVRGTVTTAGSAVLKHRPMPVADAVVVSRATQAGMVSLGKTNLTEFAYSGLGLNPHFGTPANPHATGEARVPGGSSSGSAVAVARGAVPLAAGTDTAGSIRVPAAFNGLVGYKSSTRRYPLKGVFPLAPTLDSVGPLTRSVRDCYLLDAIFRGCPEPEPLRPMPLRAQRFIIEQSVLEDARIERAVRQNLEQAAAFLAAAGACIESRPVLAIQGTMALIERHGWLGAPEALATHESLLASDEADRLDDRVKTRLLSARNMPATDLVHLHWGREKLITQLEEELDGAVLILPTVGHVAPLLRPLEEDRDRFAAVNLATLRLTMPGSFLDTPGVALPTGVDAGGLPTSMLLSLPQGEDDRLLRLAASVELTLAKSASGKPGQTNLQSSPYVVRHSL